MSACLHEMIPPQQIFQTDAKGQLAMRERFGAAAA